MRIFTQPQSSCYGVALKWGVHVLFIFCQCPLKTATFQYNADMRILYDVIYLFAVFPSEDDDVVTSPYV